MSLIRDALKKEAAQTGVPLTPVPEKGEGKKKKGWNLGQKKGWAIIFLLLFSGGLGVYWLFPGRSGPNLMSPPPVPLPKVLSQGSHSTEPGAENKHIGEGGTGIPAGGASLGMVVVTSPQAAKPKSATVFIPQSTPSGTKTFKAALTKTRSESGKNSDRGSEKEAEALQVVRLFNEAVLAQQKKQFPQAIQTYQELLVLRPSHWESYNNLGLLYQELKQYDKAWEMFQTCLTLNPRYLKGMNNLGLLLLHQGKIEEAGVWFRKILDIEPRFSPALINLAAVMNRQGEPEQARKYLLKVLENEGENPEACYNLGLIWEKQGAEKKALEYYRKFIFNAHGPYVPLAEELKKRWPELQ
jgi:Flp pilus assembly protein TadD